MIQQRTYHHRLALLAAVTCLLLTVSAHGGPPGGGGGYYPSSGSSSDDATGNGGNSFFPSSGSSSSDPRGGNGNGPGGGRNGAQGGAGGPGFDIDSALTFRRIHGILAAVAMVVLFPIGSILLRVLPGRFAVWVHGVFQLLAWCVYVAGAAVGVYLVTVVRVPGGGLLQNPSTRYHPIIGLVLLALFVVQPIVGFVHHRVYKKVERRQIWSYVHLTIGRVGVTLGIVNGGLGLYLSGASAYITRVYVIVAAIIWALWMAVALFAEIRRVRKSRRAGDGVKTKVVTKAPPTEPRSSQE